MAENETEVKAAEPVEPVDVEKANAARIQARVDAHRAAKAAKLAEKK